MTAAALLLLLQVQIPVAPNGVTVHTVDAGESIAQVLVGASAGDTIRLALGEYHENLVIETPVVLTGPNCTIGSSPEPCQLPTIRGGYEGNVVHVLATGTILDGIHVSEAGPRLTKDMANILVEADSVTIRKSLLTESLHGIYVKGGSFARIEGNRIEGRLDLIESDRGNGIHLWNSTNNSVFENEILNVRDGIYFSFSDSTQVADNHIHHVRYGLHYMYSNHNTFTNNLFEKNVAGAALMYSEDIELTGNTFAYCRGFRAYGILLQSMDRVTAESNLVIDNSRGVFINNSSQNVIQWNDIVDNDVAIQLKGVSDRNAFLQNNFINNLSELLLDVSDRETIWANEAGGNYWSGHDSYDLDRDGIGDMGVGIQNVFQVMESNTPEVRFYLLSPAAKILEIAENTLPILDLSDARDPSPLMSPMENDAVPWEMLVAGRHDASLGWAGFYLCFALVPLAALALKRRGRCPTSNNTRERLG
jgi:nitrous oxidase accessory protein